MRIAFPASLALAMVLSCGGKEPESVQQASDRPTTGTVEQSKDVAASQDTKVKVSFRDSPAYATLLKAEYFEYPWVGRQMEPSRNAIAFEELLACAGADEAMAELMNAEHAPQVRLYGLCGLYFTDPEAFREECNHLSRLRVTVGYLKGDTLLSAQPLSTLIRAEDGEPVLTFPDPDRAVSQWKARVAEKSGGYTLDILHGGLPTGLRLAGSGKAP